MLFYFSFFVVVRFAVCPLASVRPVEQNTKHASLPYGFSFFFRLPFLRRCKAVRHHHQLLDMPVCLLVVAPAFGPFRLYTFIVLRGKWPRNYRYYH